MTKSPTLTSPAPLQTAVLFLVFNRPDTTAQVFEAIRQAKPPRLYVAADGPREGREGEAELVIKVREIATTVDWPCEVKTLYRSENLGCKKAVSSAITWFFELEEQGIILEDDCLPHSDFFVFCETLLNRYAYDDRMAVVTGNNFQYGRKYGHASYYFSKFNHCWGWATWRRAWRYYQGDLPFWPEWRDKPVWKHMLADPVEQKYWAQIFDQVKSNAIDSWAYPWTASVWYHGGLTATPNVNLVSNIGFGANATHTKVAGGPLANLSTQSLGKITHPDVVAQNHTADRYVFDSIFGGSHYRWGPRAFRLLRRFIAVFSKSRL